jgi:hypothetical protein
LILPVARLIRLLGAGAAEKGLFRNRFRK